MSKPGQHVVPSSGRWAVRKSGSAKVSRTYRTQKEAVAAARKIAKNQSTELYIHGRDGKIRERDSFGNDPVRSKG